MPDTISISTFQELRGHGLVSSAFSATAMRDGLIHLHRSRFPAGNISLAELCAFGDVELAEQLPAGASALLRPEPSMLIHLWVARGQGEVAVAGASRDAVTRVATDIAASLADPELDRERVPVTFWAQTAAAPMNPRREIVAPGWAEIAANYPPAVREQLDTLMAATEPGPGGLVLWHGDPGTGKSHALRALAREWRDWCDVHFITDADAFLGAQTGYLLDTLLRPPERSARSNKWRLIVLEDAGELLAADARAVTGQGLSRLLNLSDGLLGAGLRALVLVTTNEPLRRLHPAVVRAGRTWTEIEFTPFDADGANRWLADHDVEERVDAGLVLADLFALRAGRPVVPAVPMGFAT